MIRGNPGIIVADEVNPADFHEKTHNRAAVPIGDSPGRIDPSLIEIISFRKQTIESAASASDIFEREYTSLTHYNQPRQSG